MAGSLPQTEDLKSASRSGCGYSKPWSLSALAFLSAHWERGDPDTENLLAPARRNEGASRGWKWDCGINGLKLPNLPLTSEGEGEVIISTPC